MFQNKNFTLLMIVIFTALNSTGAYSQNGWQLISSPSLYPISKIFFVDENNGYCAEYKRSGFTREGLILKTSDSGYNWLLIRNDSIDYTALFFTNVNTGWVTGSYSTWGTFLFKTTNGGVNFTLQLLHNSIGAIYTIFFLDSLNGWAGGSPGVFLKTTNGGTNWSIIINNDYSSNECIKFINYQTGYTATWEYTQPACAYVLKTTNGGNNWYVRYVYDQNAFYGIDFINANTGWVCGTNGAIFKTLNGGASWVNVSNYTTSQYFSTRFLSYNTGYVSGSNGTILHTTDGGSSWSLQYNNGGQFIYTLYFLNNTTAWAAGGTFNPVNDFVMKTTNGGFTGFQKISEVVPGANFLYQNYPNPFNPETNIRFDIAEKTDVKLSVFDILGKEIGIITNTVLESGQYKYVWNGSPYSSGTYIIRLYVGNSILTQKMLLIK